MKKTMTTFIVMLSTMLVITACNSNSTNENIENNGSNQNNTASNVDTENNQQNNDLQEELNNNNSQEDELESSEDSLPDENKVDESAGSQLAGSLFTVAQLEGGLSVGDTQEDVSILFDSHPYHEVTAFMDGADAWRYDIGAPPEYSYDVETDAHDQEGILGGDVPLQIFIYFDENGNVSSYTAYQAGEEGTITVYQTLADGSRKVDTIN